MQLSEITGIKFPSRTWEVSDVWALPKQMVGIEVEFEDYRPKSAVDVPEMWEYHEDGSLRNNGAEFVLEEPLFGADLLTAINNMEEWFNSNGHAKKSSRTSTHLHFDFRNRSKEDLIRVAFMHSIFEKILFKYTKSNRDNNHFCVPWWMNDGEAQRKLWEVLSKENKKLVVAAINSFQKYTALNLSVLNQLGSIEFRHHQALFTSRELIEWINILMRLIKYAISLKDITEEFASISFMGAAKYTREVFGPELGERLMYDGIDVDLYYGVRYAQDVVHQAELTAVSEEILFEEIEEVPLLNVDDFILTHMGDV